MHSLRIASLLILPVILSPAVMIRAADEPKSESKPKEVLAVRLVRPEQPVPVEKRVKMVVKITNVSDKAINLPWPQYINQFLKTESTGGDATVLSVRHSGLSLGNGRYPGGDLEPGDEMSVEVWHIFPAPGSHNMQCVLETSRKGTPWWNFWEGRVASTPITIQVTNKGN